VQDLPLPTHLKHTLTILVDHNIEGQAVLLWGTLTASGWLELLPLRLVTLAQVGLPYDSSDRKMWRFAQDNGMILLTANRRMDGEDSWSKPSAKRTPQLHYLC
jgi:hypothetical protein